MTHAAVERVVVQTSAADKRSFVAKAKRLGVPVSELMRRGAFAYSPKDDDKELALLADAAREAAELSCAAIDDAMRFIEASNLRIAAMASDTAVRVDTDAENSAQFRADRLATLVKIFDMPSQANAGRVDPIIDSGFLESDQFTGSLGAKSLGEILNVLKQAKPRSTKASPNPTPKPSKVRAAPAAGAAR